MPVCFMCMGIEGCVKTMYVMVSGNCAGQRSHHYSFFIGQLVHFASIISFFVKTQNTATWFMLYINHLLKYTNLIYEIHSITNEFIHPAGLVAFLSMIAMFLKVCDKPISVINNTYHRLASFEHG